MSSGGIVNGLAGGTPGCIFDGFIGCRPGDTLTSSSSMAIVSGFPGGAFGCFFDGFIGSSLGVSGGI